MGPGSRPSGVRDIKPTEELLPRKKRKETLKSKGPFARILIKQGAHYEAN
jgi:hypothetical protein